MTDAGRGQTRRSQTWWEDLWAHPAKRFIETHLLNAYSDHDECSAVSCHHRADAEDDADRIAHALLMVLRDEGYEVVRCICADMLPAGASVRPCSVHGCHDHRWYVEDVSQGMVPRTLCRVCPAERPRSDDARSQP